MLTNARGAAVLAGTVTRATFSGLPIVGCCNDYTASSVPDPFLDFADSIEVPAFVTDVVHDGDGPTPALSAALRAYSKWFVPGLSDGSLGFGGEESAGAAFLRLDGTTWVTDKDGIIMDLLAAEMLAVTGKNPSVLYHDLTASLGEPIYERIDAPASRAQKAALQKFSPQQVQRRELAGEAITAMLTDAPGNHASIGGLKVTTANGWFAARPSGTEDVYKLYAESFKGQAHLRRIQDDAQALIKQVFTAAGA